MKVTLTATWKWARHARLEDLDPFPAFASDELRSQLWGAARWRQEPGDDAPRHAGSGRWRLYVSVAAGNSEDVVLPEVELGETILHGVDVDARALWLTVTGELRLDPSIDLTDHEALFELKPAAMLEDWLRRCFLLVLVLLVPTGLFWWALAALEDLKLEKLAIEGV